MAGIQDKPEPVSQPLGEIAELLRGNLEDLAASVAHQVHVLMRLGGVARRTVPEVGVSDQFEALQQVERAVDGGDVDCRCDSLDVFANPLRGGVLQLPHRVEHELALRGHPHPPLVQCVPQAGIHNMMVAPRTASERVLALLNGGVVDPNAPLLRADDLGVLRGEGVFETVLVVDGVAVELEAHLARLARSTAMLDLPAPDLRAWRACVQATIDAWDGGPEMVLRLVLTRGPETCSQGRGINSETCSQGGGLVGYALGTPVSSTVLAQRRDGIAAVTLTRGTVSDLSGEAPWLLLGAKTLSYAANMAAIRHAERLGAHDAVFVAADGSVLEGPTSTVVVANGTTLRTPPAELGILAGITQAALFRAAEAAGWHTRVESLKVADLHAANGMWLCSSVRLITRVHTLDGHPLPDAGLTDTLRALLPLRLPNPSRRD